MSLSIPLPLENLYVHDQHATRRDPGTYLRILRVEKGIRPTDIERRSRLVAESKGDQEFFISHSALASMENGSIPGIHKIFSLAVCLDISMECILHIFGVNAPEVVKFRYARDNESRNPGPILITNHRKSTQPDASYSSASTRMLHRDVNMLPSQVAVYFKQPDHERYRYATIGTDDDSMKEIIPAGALIEVDPRQCTIAISEWDALQKRPIYLLWHEEGYSCGWCQLDGKKLLLLPHPATSQYKVRIFRMPGEVTIIGRVTYVWPPAIRNELGLGILAPLLTGMAD